MTAVGPAGALLVAPAAASRSARDSAARFEDVFGAATVGLALDEEPDVAGETTSPHVGESAESADGGEAARLLAATPVVIVAPAQPTGGSPVGSADATAADPAPADLAVVDVVHPMPTSAATEESGALADARAISASAAGVVEQTPARTLGAAGGAATATTLEDVLTSPSGRAATTAVAEARTPVAPVGPATAPTGAVAIATAEEPTAAGDVRAAADAGAASAERASNASPRSAVPTPSLQAGAAAALASAPSTPASAVAPAVDDTVPASPAGSAPITVAAAAPATVANPVDPAPPPPPSAARAVAAQVSPVVVSIAQRPAGTHQLTMTVNPDTLGPVTVRAHIGAGGDVRVELIGATDAGRDALRAIVADLRRDLATAMPHATLSIAQGAGSDAAADRGGQGFSASSGEQGSGEQGAAGRGAVRETPAAAASDQGATESPRPRTTIAPAPGSGLDILA